ncbi:coiled-coil domain-containing protein 63-like [Lineus longissimus]|uniref:coiled-coil domain-containing protein 63-like n=1 Tax=Lineus longissimus TaxID=88925 RepID=UPI002B4F89D8
MPRIRSAGARSDMSDADAEGITEREQELEKLKRQHRIMQCQREDYTEESQNLIRRQKNEIEQLEDDKRDLLVDMRLAESRCNENKDNKNCDELSNLADEKDFMEQEVEDERNLHMELDSELRAWEKKIREQHKKMGGVHMSGAHTVQTQKKARTLENRLDQALKKFNSALTINSDLRDEIDSLRNERKRFENIYKRLDKELQQLRRDIGEVIDTSTQSYDARDEAQAKMILLKEKADKDLQQHNAEMKELIRIIEHDRKLKEFMGIKGQERQEDPQLVAWRQKMAYEAKKKRENEEDSVETYEAAFNKIQELMEEEDLNALVKKFIETEDQNFALFNYVNEQNNQIDMLQDHIAEIKSEIDKFNSQGAEMEAERKVIMKQLEEKQVISSKQADEFEERFKEVMKILDQLRAGIESLFKKINCDRAAIDDMLGAQQGVTDNNMIQYLGIIEQRTNELLGIQTYMTAKDYEKYDPKAATGLLGEGPLPPAPPPHVLAPTVGDEYESEASEASDDERPFTRSELTNKVMKTVKKREIAARNQGDKYDLSNAREKTQKKKSEKK